MKFEAVQIHFFKWSFRLVVIYIYATMAMWLYDFSSLLSHTFRTAFETP